MMPRMMWLFRDFCVFKAEIPLVSKRRNYRLIISEALFRASIIPVLHSGEARLPRSWAPHSGWSGVGARNRRIRECQQRNRGAAGIGQAWPLVYALQVA